MNDKKFIPLQKVIWSILRYSYIIILACLLAACGETGQQETENSVYYWRTEWLLDSVEQGFLKAHDIQKVYCRYFDVVMGDDGEPTPNATIRFHDEVLPEGVEMVPTVYVTEDCMHQRHEGLAGRLVQRIVQMNETHGIRGVREIQIDCDYTARSRQVYYDFLSEVARSALFTRHFSLLSVTIRLHQLTMAVPPADYGVLMLYNTGDPRRFVEHNPILDESQVQPYLRYLSDYALPLSAAYPVYRWQRTIHGVRVEHTVEASEILRVKQAVERKRPSLRERILTYHLDKENINRYTPET